MKSIIKSILTAASALTLIAAPAQAGRTLVLLHESDQADSIANSIAERLNTETFRQVANLKYDAFVNLSDTDATRQKLLNTLISQTNAGNSIDLCILGAGGADRIQLHSDESLTGRRGTSSGNIRTLLTEARTREGNPQYKFNLRLVAMSNRLSATLNDDWVAAGAGTTCGTRSSSAVSQVALAQFWAGFLEMDKEVVMAAADANANYSVAGNPNLIFRSEMQLRVGQERTVVVRADEVDNLIKIYSHPGSQHTFAARSADRWVGGDFAPECSAAGVNPGPFDALRRLGNAKQMALCGELSRFHDEKSFVNGSIFSIGMAKTHSSSSRRGFYNLWANDVLAGYGDNSGSIRVTVKRTR